ncbi:helix-turn-helix transcriptional regulator [Ligilactobacillus murinus]|nr:helix-turn-helix transcriptional regulator [Ligilactobacillus murinus]
MEKLNNNRIKEVRLEQKKKQKEVASFLGITEQALSYYERGKREPKLETWQKLADYFDVPIPYLQGLGVSRDTVISDLIDEMMEDNKRYNPNDKTDSFSLGFDLTIRLEHKITKEDIKYIEKNFDYDSSVTDELYSDVIDDFIVMNDRDGLSYFIKKYIPLVCNYDFLSSLDRTSTDEYFFKLYEKYMNDTIKERRQNAVVKLKSKWDKGEGYFSFFDDIWQYLSEQGFKLTDNIKLELISRFRDTFETVDEFKEQYYKDDTHKQDKP